MQLAFAFMSLSEVMIANLDRARNVLHAHKY